MGGNNNLVLKRMFGAPNRPQSTTEAGTSKDQKPRSSLLTSKKKPFRLSSNSDAASDGPASPNKEGKGLINTNS